MKELVQIVHGHTPKEPVLRGSASKLTTSRKTKKSFVQVSDWQARTWWKNPQSPEQRAVHLINHTPCLPLATPEIDSSSDIQPMTSIAEQIRDAMRQAWDEGYRGGDRDAATRRMVKEILAKYPEQDAPAVDSHNPYAPEEGEPNRPKQ